VEPAVSRKDTEVILMRQLASYLAMPIVVIASDGTLIYYNEPAAALVGRRFDETGEMSRPRHFDEMLDKVLEDAGRTSRPVELLAGREGATFNVG